VTGVPKSLNDQQLMQPYRIRVLPAQQAVYLIQRVRLRQRVSAPCGQGALRRHSDYRLILELRNNPGGAERFRPLSPRVRGSSPWRRTRPDLGSRTPTLIVSTSAWEDLWNHGLGCQSTGTDARHPVREAAAIPGPRAAGRLSSTTCSRPCHRQTAADSSVGSGSPGCSGNRSASCAERDRNRGQFPSELAALKVPYLAVRNLKDYRGRKVGVRSSGWKHALQVFTIYFETRIPTP
jgi:hypothetical protein